MEEKGLQVIEVMAENFKVLKAFHFTPKEDITLITGANGEGKTTAVDLIWAAMDAAGYMKATQTVKPIRDGEKRGFIKVTLGNGSKAELVVTRKFNPSGITVEVATAEGAVFKSPQDILNALYGAISFDPMGFATKKPEGQLKEILDLVPLSIDLNEWGRERKEIFDRRTEVNRSAKEKEGFYLSLPIPTDDTPDEELKSEAILKKIQDAQDTIKKHNQKRQELADARTEAQSLVGQVKAKEERIGADRERIEELRLQIQDLEESIKVEEKEKAKLQDDVDAKVKAGKILAAEVDALQDPNIEGFNEELRTLEETNKKVRDKLRRNEAKVEWDKLTRESQKLTDQLEDHDEKRAKAIKEATWPVDGMGVDDSGITFNGIPFSQASSAQKLRVSLAIAIALNPRLKFLRIMDGSLLDSKSMGIIREMCADNGYRAFIEKVDETGAIGVFIQNGEVVAVNP